LVIVSPIFLAAYESTAICCLAFLTQTLKMPTMKFALAILVYLLMAAILGAGIVLLVSGKPLFFIIVFIAYVVAFGRLGCMTH
jgi:hypothetical protein